MKVCTTKKLEPPVKKLYNKGIELITNINFCLGFCLGDYIVFYFCWGSCDCNHMAFFVPKFSFYFFKSCKEHNLIITHSTVILNTSSIELVLNSQFYEC